MYNGIGLQTPRGSGTNGYIQTNKFFIRPKTGKVAHTTGGFEGDQGTAGITKKPNKEILEHDRKRQILLKLTILEDKLIEQGYTDAEIEEKLQETRKTLEAADASEASGGPTAVVVSDKKVSDTQSHQIAARKEKQMETLRAALGIRASDSTEEIIEGSDDGPINGRKIDPSQKREHAFLDREFSRKKHVVEDLEEEKDDQKRGDKALKNKKKEKDDVDDSRLIRKEESRRRRHQADSSDTDSGEKPAKGSRKKHRKGRHRSGDETDSDSDYGRKNISSKKHKRRRRRHESESDDSATDDETDSGDGKKRSGTFAKRKQSRSSSDSDDSATDDDAGKVSLHQEVEKYRKSRKRHDSDDDDDFDVMGRWESGKKRSGAIAKRNQSRRSSDCDDSATDDDAGKVSQNQEVQKYEKSHKRHHSDDDDDFDVRGRRESGGVHGKGRRNSERDGDSDLDKAGKHKKEVGSRSQKMNDAKGNNFDAGIDEKLEKSRSSSRHDAHEEDSYVRGGRNSSRKTLGRGTVGRELDSLNDDSYDSSSSDSDSSASDYRRGKHKKKNPMDKIRSGGGDRRQAIEKKLDNRDDDSEGSSRSSDSDSSGSDYRHGQTIKKGSTDKNRTGAGSGVHNKGGQSGSEYNLEEKGFSSADVGHADGTRELYKSGRETMDKTNRGIQEIGSSKRKLDGAIKDEERQFKSRNKTAGKGTQHDDDCLGELKSESELPNRAYHNRDDQRRDDYSKSHRSRGHGDENVERRSREYREHAKEKMAKRDDKDHRGRSYQGHEEGGDEFRRHRKYDGDQLYGSRNDQENKEHAGDERHSRDAEDHRGRRYQGNEEHTDEYRRHGKDDGDQRYGSRRRGREDEEERANRVHERDRWVDHSKRARYDDPYSGERKRYDDDKRDGDRARYRD